MCGQASDLHGGLLPAGLVRTNSLGDPLPYFKAPVSHLSELGQVRVAGVWAVESEIFGVNATSRSAMLSKPAQPAEKTGPPAPEAEEPLRGHPPDT